MKLWIFECDHADYEEDYGVVIAAPHRTRARKIMKDHLEDSRQKIQDFKVREIKLEELEPGIILVANVGA